MNSEIPWEREGMREIGTAPDMNCQALGVGDSPHFPLQGGRTGATLLGTLFREGGGMRKILGRAEFFPLPLREKAG